MSWRPPGRHRSSLSSLSLHLSLEESLGPISSSVFPSEKQPCVCEEYTRLLSPFSDFECDGIVTSRYQSSDFNSGYAKTGCILCIPEKTSGRQRRDTSALLCSYPGSVGTRETQRNEAGHPALASPPSFVTQLRICADAHHAAVRGDLDSSS